VPATAKFEIVSVPEPAFVTVIVWLSVTPIAAVPKLTLVGDTTITGCPALVAVPVNAIVETAGLVLAVIEIMPDTVPDVVGANFAAYVMPLPAATVIGKVNPDTEYPAPVVASCVMVSVAVPVFVTVKVWDADDPVATLPNDPVAPPTTTVVVVVGSVALAPVSPMQPTWAMLISRVVANSKEITGLRCAGCGGRTCDLEVLSDSIGVIRWLIITR